MISPAYGLALDAKISDSKSLADCYGHWSGIRSNHVITAGGKFSGPDGSSRSISTIQDRELLIELRKRADLIVVDAATARREQYKAPSSGTALAIFSRTGRFSGIPAFEQAGVPLFLFSPVALADAKGHRYEVIANDNNPLRVLTEFSGKEGFEAILLEAGPTLSQTAFDNGLVSQSALTISGQNPTVDLGSNSHPFDDLASLLSVAHSENVTFTYWNH